MIELDKIYYEDCLKGLKHLGDCTVDCVVTSPPYYALRDYGVDGQVGLEDSPKKYIRKLVKIFREVLRVMKPMGTCWVVIGDSYAGSNKGAAAYPENAKLYKQGTNKGTMSPGIRIKYKTEAKERDLIGIPWMLAFALRDLGFYLRQDIIWHKPNPMPESCTCRCTKSHEYIFMLTKSAKYYFDGKALREPANTGVRPNEYNHRKVKSKKKGDDESNSQSSSKSGRNSNNTGHDLNLRLDVSYRKQANISRDIATMTSSASSGNTAFKLSFTADYTLSRMLTMSFYYDMQTNTPLLSSSSYPTTTHDFGFNMKFSLTH